MKETYHFYLWSLLKIMPLSGWPVFVKVMSKSHSNELHEIL